MPKKTASASAQDVAEENGAQIPRTDLENAGNPADMPGIPAGDAEETLKPQTDSKNLEFSENLSGLQGKLSQNAPESQTGAENDDHLAENPDSRVENPDAPRTELESDVDEGANSSPEQTISSGTSSDDDAPQTDTESGVDEAGSAAQGPLQQEKPPVSLTGSEQGDNLAESVKSAAKIPDSQIGSENAPQDSELPEESPKKPGRRTTKSQSGDNSVPSENSDENNPKPARRRRTREEPVLAIDEQRTVETSEDKLRNDLLDLVESQKGRKILTGAIQGVERSADNPNLSFAVIYHGAFKVIIPAEETVRPPEDFRDRSPADVMHYLVTKRLGAEVDYIVKGVDAKSGIAAASRLEAMALKRRQYYFGTDRNGNNLLYEDISAEARVVSVIRAGMFVDLFGLETYIPLRELSYQRWIDATAHFQPGQRVLVKILKLDRSDRNNIRVTASVKQAAENPYEQALKRYTPGSRYVGTVSMVDTNGVFVSLEGGVDCLCSYPKRGRPPRGARVTVRIIGVNHENNRIWGAITHMTTAR